MSEIMSGLAGSEMLSDFTGTSNNTTAKSLTAQPEKGEKEGFPALFASITADDSETSLDLNNLTEMTHPLLLTGELSPTDPFTTSQASFNSMAQYGNNLPYGQPIVSVNGHVAFGDQHGASAMSFLGDGKQLLMSAPQSAVTIPMALQASHQQVTDSLALPALPLQEDAIANFPFAEAIKRSDLTALTTLANDGEMSMPVQASPVLHNPPSVQHALMATDLSVTTAATPKPEAMTANLQQPHWNTEVGERINWIIAQGLKQAEIRLNPPELGLLEVRVQLQGDQANIQFSSPHAQVRDALDAALPRLREMLAETGLSLGDANISQHSFTQNQSADEQSQGHGSLQKRTESEGMDSEMEMTTPIKISGSSILDVFA